MMRGAVLLVLLSTTLCRPGAAGAAEGTIEGRVWKRDGKVLVEVRADRGTFDGLRLELPSAAGVPPETRLPAGWSPDSSQPFGVVGEPRSHLLVRFDLPRGTRIPDKLRLEVLSAGEKVFKEKVEVVGSPRPEPVEDPGGLVSIPPLLAPGGEVQIGVARMGVPDAALLPEFVSGVTVTYRGPKDLVEVPLTPTDPERPWAGSFTGRLPAEFPAPPQLDVLDAFGESLYTGSLEQQLVPATSWPQTPFLSGVSDKAAIGSTFCVCGYVPSLDDWANLLLAGQPLGAPLYASNLVAGFEVPPIPPGGHVVEPAGSAGFSGGRPREGLETEVIEIQAGIREEAIRTGQRTVVYFKVLGTEDPMPFDLELVSQGVGQLEGGNRQTATTAGGGNNGFEREVVGLKPGQFNVNWGTEAGNCPEARPPAGSAPQPGLDPALEKLYADAFLEVLEETGKEKIDPAPPVTGQPEEPCTPTPTSLCLDNDRFRVQVDWPTPAVGGGPGLSLPPGDTGFFFFDANNTELLLKVLDGCRFNGHFWVFYAATTDVEFTLTVTDTQSGEEKSYFNPLGKPAPAIVDTQAFATCP